MDQDRLLYLLLVGWNIIYSPLDSGTVAVYNCPSQSPCLFQPMIVSLHQKASKAVWKISTRDCVGPVHYAANPQDPLQIDAEVWQSLWLQFQTAHKIYFFYSIGQKAACYLTVIL